MTLWRGHAELILSFSSALILVFRAHHLQSFVNLDGLTYMRLASYLSGGNFHEGISTYWSPLYPVLLSLLPASNLVLSAHLLNFLIAIVILVAFVRLLNRLGADLTLHFVGICALTVQLFMTIHLLTPDYLVAGLVLLSATDLIDERYTRAGLLFGLGYLAKSVIFPVGLVVFLVLIWQKRERALPGFVAFVVISLPLITFISFRVHRLSIGEAGRLNYQWTMAGYDFTTPIEKGIVPALDPTSVSTPPPSWSLARQAQVLRINLLVYGTRLLVFYLPLALLFCARFKKSEVALNQFWQLVLLGFLGLAGYGAVVTLRDPRYLFPFELLLLVGLISFTKPSPFGFDQKLCCFFAALFLMPIFFFPIGPLSESVAK